jgi:subtilisin-like proprotein convertase family protein
MRVVVSAGLCFASVAWSSDVEVPRPAPLPSTVVSKPAPASAPSARVTPARPPELTPARRTSARLDGDAGIVSALESGAARAVGLASADFDRDGLEDVAAFFSNGRQGIVVVHRANPDAYDPYTADAVRRRAGAPIETTPVFNNGALAFAAPFAPDFYGAGDFDNDGRADLLVGSKGGSSFAVLPGDGAGAFGAPRVVAVEGKLSALAVGHVNHDDGIADIVAAVAAKGAPCLRVYESPGGALQADPETITLPANATALAIGELQGDQSGDVVALAGRELLIVRGRDRRLDDRAERAAAVPPATVERRRIGLEGRSLALGRFTHDAVTDIVVIDAAGAAYRTPGHRAAALEPLGAIGGTRRAMAAGVSASRREDLLLLGDAPGARLRAGSGFDLRLDLEGAAVAALPLRLNADAADDLVFLEQEGRGQLTTTQLAPAAIFFVTNALDGGPGSLRQAIADANTIGGADQIHFAIPGVGPHIIATLSPLPTIVDRVTIDGRTQPGWAGTPIVFVDGTSSGAPCGLCFNAFGADGSAVLGLGVQNVPGDGIRLDDAWACVVDECYLGIDPSGTVAAPNTNGVAVLNSKFDRVGAARGNLISGNIWNGVYLAGGPSGSSWTSSDVPKPIPDLSTAVSTLDVSFQATVEDVDVTLDITHTFDGDLVITLISPAGTSVSLAVNVGGSGDNFTGTTFDDEAGTPIAAGAAPFTGSFIPSFPLSAFDGAPMDGTWTLRVDDTAGVDFGTLNSWSLSFQHRTSDNVVQRNRIGTDASGSLAVPNDYGVVISDEASDMIGGSAVGDGNLISGNLTSGVWIRGSLARGHRIEGNRIGTNAAGSAALGNGRYGVVLIFGPSGNTVGGTAAGAGNVIAAHPIYGIAVQSVRGNRYQGNYVGTDLTGSVAIPNLYGFASFDARNELIGGSVPGARNVVSGNTLAGIYLDAFGGGGNNSVIGNAVGTNAAGTAALGNDTGVHLFEDNDGVGENLISGNANDGVYLPTGGHYLWGNLIGLDAAAAAPIPNRNGVHVSGGRFNSIGSPFAPANVIAGNLADGVLIEGSPVVGPATYVSGDVPKPIPDLATTTSTLSIADDGVILDLDVRLDLTHTFDADLDLTLVDPAGVRIPLAQNRGGGGNDYTGTAFDDEAATPISAGVAPFSGIFRPEQPLAYLDGNDLGGTWTLEIVDEVGGDSGTLNAWQLTVTTAGPLDNGVYGNVIGTNNFGVAGLENGGHGVHLVGAARNRVGDPFGGNTISGNRWGVLAESAASAGNLIEYNYAGLISATNALGGIAVDGGLGNGITGNTLTRNGGPGAAVVTGYNNQLIGNACLDNTGLGIDLAPPGVNPNDAPDSDAGPNDLQNYPVITSLVPFDATHHQIFGTLTTEPNRDFRLDVYTSASGDPSGHGEGHSWVGNVLVGSGPPGSAPFSFVVPTGGFYSVTATGPGGSTSEFSGAFALPQEVPDTMVAAKLGPSLQVTYAPACGASDHAVFWGLGPISPSVSWTGAQCGFGASGLLVFNPGVPPAGKFFYWVVVGQTFSLEGSYGQSSSAVERPEAVGLGVCELPQSLIGPCP